MATKKPTPSIRKPTIEKARDFAQVRKQSKSGLVPDGDKRLVCNIRGDLHRKVKQAALDNDITVGEIIEGLVEKHL